MPWNKTTANCLLGLVLSQDAPSPAPAFHDPELPALEYIDDFGSEQQDLFKAITERFKKQHGNAGGLCLRCVRIGEEHGTH
jgi:hypothetical protein